MGITADFIFAIKESDVGSDSIGLNGTKESLGKYSSNLSLNSNFCLLVISVKEVLNEFFIAFLYLFVYSTSLLGEPRR